MSTAAVFDDPFIPAGAGAAAPAIPLAEIAPWAVLGALLATVLLYFVSTEQGAFALFDGMYVHEFVHDARHLLGFPCH
ncbi:CbtB domain-containing protein [Sphingomonas solaris]|uniref:CbtB-domain containing protein n=1 Tax=Alterirhizorhabdus solaris TaxID=2529389 RepID=A0A558QXW7_9SPHN|nr:CbtB-domain containing protein [Sphingomonas solaris]TVV71939.1 CbtB-domain containing protein [Sphingomonas solaris]